MQSDGEEIANSVSQGIGLLAVGGIIPVLVVNADRRIVRAVPANVGLTEWQIVPDLTICCVLLCYQYLTENRAATFCHIWQILLLMHLSRYVPNIPEVKQTQGVDENTKLVAYLMQ